MDLQGLYLSYELAIGLAGHLSCSEDGTLHLCGRDTATGCVLIYDGGQRSMVKELSSAGGRDTAVYCEMLHVLPCRTPALVA